MACVLLDLVFERDVGHVGDEPVARSDHLSVLRRLRVALLMRFHFMCGARGASNLVSPIININLRLWRLQIQRLKLQCTFGSLRWFLCIGDYINNGFVGFSVVLAFVQQDAGWGGRQAARDEPVVVRFFRVLVDALGGLVPV